MPDRGNADRQLLFSALGDEDICAHTGSLESSPVPI